MLRADKGWQAQGPIRLLVLCIAMFSLCFGLMGCATVSSQEELVAQVAELDTKVEKLVQQQEDADKDLEKQVLAILADQDGRGSSRSRSGKLEEQVLEILEQNPETIIGSVQTYQQEQQRQQAQARADQQAEVIAQVRENIEELVGDSPRKGAETFELVMLEFSDFQCPFCARAVPTVEQFIEEHGDEVMLVYKHLPLVRIHPEAVPAAEASWAAQQQGKFWEYHDLLFENQGALGEDYYIEAAEELDLDIDQFNEDRNSEAAEEAVLADQEIAAQLQIGGTPFFLLNGQTLSGARPYQDFEQALEAAKAELG